MRLTQIVRVLCALSASLTLVAFTLGPAIGQEAKADPSEQEGGEKPQDPPIPPAQIPERQQSQEPQPQPGQPPQRITLNPNISVIGNHFARLFSVRGDEQRNRPQLGELEIGRA